jgi:hypothetical protein
VEIDPSANPDTWVLAVQWHPEERLDDLRLFAGVVDAAAAYRRGRVAPEGWAHGRRPGESDGPTPAGQGTTGERARA